MDILQRLNSGRAVLGFQVHHLASNHAIDGARSARNLLNNAHAHFGRATQAREDLIRLSLQCVSGEDCCGLAENLVARGTPAAQIVIVECR